MIERNWIRMKINKNRGKKERWFLRATILEYVIKSFSCRMFFDARRIQRNKDEFPVANYATCILHSAIWSLYSIQLPVSPWYFFPWCCANDGIRLICHWTFDIILFPNLSNYLYDKSNFASSKIVPLRFHTLACGCPYSDVLQISTFLSTCVLT